MSERVRVRVCMRLVYFTFLLYPPTDEYIFHGLLRSDVSCARTVICDTRQSRKKNALNINKVNNHQISTALIHYARIQAIRKKNFNDHFDNGGNFIVYIILNCEFFFILSGYHQLFPPKHLTMKTFLDSFNWSKN